MQKTLLLEQAVQLYLQAYLSTEAFAPRTRREYVTDVRQLCTWLATHKVRTVQTVKRSYLQAFLAHLDLLALTTATRRRKVAALRSFFRFLDETGARPGDPADELVPPEVEDRRLRYLTEEEYQRLRYVARHDSRDSAIIELFLQTGMSLSDLAGLRLEDLIQRSENISTARVGSGKHPSACSTEYESLGGTQGLFAGETG